MKRQIHFWFITLAGLLVLGQCMAADSPFIVDSWNTADDLPQRSIIAMTQTSDGYLWLGTQNGLVRFDGSHFTKFNVNNTPELPGNRIVFLFEDSRKDFWVGWSGRGNAGLCIIHNGDVKNFATGGADSRVGFAWEDETGGVWFFAANGRIFCWKNGALDLHPAITDEFWTQLSRRACHLVVPASPAEFWHLDLDSGHVEKWSGDKLEKDFGACPWEPLPVQEVLPEAQKSLPLDAKVSAACVDGNGGLIVGTHGYGVYWLDRAERWQHIDTGTNLSDDTVLSLCVDHEGNLWVGSDGGGLFRVKRNYFNSSLGLPQGVAKSAAEDASGNLWAAYIARGMAFARTNSVQTFGIGQFYNASSVLVDDQQRIWAGTLGEAGPSLFRFDGAQFQPVPVAGQPGKNILVLYQAHDGTVWVGTDNGFFGIAGNVVNIFPDGRGLSNKPVSALADDGQGGLWIGTEGSGLYSLANGKTAPVTAPVADISCLLTDPADGGLWVGTVEHGLARYSKGDWTQYSSTNGLGVDDIGYLIKDDAGNLWIGSYEGLMRATFTNSVSGVPRLVSSRTYLTRECSAGSQPAALRTHDGRLWFPTTEGFVSVDPSQLKPNTNLPPVVIESVLIDGVPQNNSPLSSVWSGAITLKPDDEQLEIHFTALDFSAPKYARQSVHFRYKLENYDKSWTDLGDSRVAHFPKLPPGDYTFHVIACNEDGYWNEAGASLAITVEPPFWRKPGFIIISLLILLGALAGTIYLISTAKLKRQLRKLHQKELIEGERARIARDLHDQIGANLTQVALLGEMAEADRELPAEVEEHAKQICETARETTHALDEIVWAVNPANDTLEGLANYCCKYAQDYFALAKISFRAELPPQFPPTPILPEVRHNVFLAFKEAVNNVVKHAQASSARVRLRLEPDRFVLSVEDNGRGLGDLSGKQLRNGMKNMRRRLSDVRGEFEIGPGPEGGTVVQLVVPITRPKS